MNLVEQIAKLSRELPEEKQEEVLDFVEFLTARHARKTWTVAERQSIIARTMGCLAGSRTSSAAFAERKIEEKAKEDRRWKS
jgi:TctA family transporter